MEDTLSKFMSESAKRHEEKSNLIKEIRASTDATIRNKGASIKTLEIQIGEISKVLQDRRFESLPSSTKANPRDQVKSISTTIKADSYPIHQKKGSYRPQFSEAYSEASHINNSIPRKEKDPGSFTLPCFINNVDAVVVNINFAKLIWDDLLLKLKKKHREKVVPYSRFISLLLEYKMQDYENDKATPNLTPIFSVHKWALKKDQPEGPPFTNHMLAICSANEPDRRVIKSLLISPKPSPTGHSNRDFVPLAMYADDDLDRLLSSRMAMKCWKMVWDDVPIVPSDGRENELQLRLNSAPIYRFLMVYGVTDSLVYAVTLLM
ncbi:hypothetical protein Tco_0319771 [Tanacetum coccineum]